MRAHSLKSGFSQLRQPSQSSVPLFVFVGGVSIISERQLLLLPQNSFPTNPPLPLPPSRFLVQTLNPPNPIKSRSSGWMLSRRSSNSVYGKKSRAPVVSISICIGKLHTIRREVLEEFHEALFRVASGHGEGGLHLSQDDPSKIAPFAICPSVYTCSHGDYTAVLTRHLFGEDETNLLQPPFHFNQRASKKSQMFRACRLWMDWLLRTGLLGESVVEFGYKTYICSSDLHYFFHLYRLKIFQMFKNDSETTTLVRGMHGLFEPVFPLTTNKYPCQSVSVYLACLSAVPHVFSCVWLTYVTIYCKTTLVFSLYSLGEQVLPQALYVVVGLLIYSQNLPIPTLE